MSTFSDKLAHLISSRAHIISRMNRPPPAEGDDLEKLCGITKLPSVTDDVPPVNQAVWPEEKSAPVSVILPPIETFMDVPEDLRRERFFATAQKGDILTGYISAMQDSGLVITVISCDCGPRRDFDGGFCPVRQIPRTNAGNPLDTFQINDRVRIVILDIHSGGRLILTMNAKMIDRKLYGEVKLGIITNEDLPIHYKKLQNLDNKSFEECLETTPQFHNPDGINVLCKRFGIPRSSICSLLFPYAKLSLPKSEMGVELRRSQLRSLSMKRVAQGVKYFKDGRHNEALQCYNFAIEIEDSNPDAYVAKGALYASSGNYSKAIDDFEKALLLKATHVNAKNYLGQTLVAYANEIQSKDSIKAQKLLKRAIVVDRNNSDARSLLRHISGTEQLTDEEIIESDSADKGKIRKEKNSRAWSRSISRSPRHGETANTKPISPQNRSRSNAYTDQNRVREQQTKRSRSPNQSPQDRYRGRYVNNDQHARRNDVNRNFEKIVITKDSGGRTIRQEAPEEMQRSRSGDEDQNNNDSRENVPFRHQRRVYTPPKDVRRTEDGGLTKYDNVNDLPTSSKVLQERLQAKLAAIERRHGGPDREPSNEGRSPSPGAVGQQPSRQNLWVPPTGYDQQRTRGRGGSFRPPDRRDGDRRFDNFRPRGGYEGRGRGRFPPRGARGGGRHYSRSPKRSRSRSRSRGPDDSMESHGRRSSSGGRSPGGFRRRPFGGGYRGGGGGGNRGRFDRRGGGFRQYDRDRRNHRDKRSRSGSSRSPSRSRSSSRGVSNDKKQRRKQSSSRSPSRSPVMNKGKKANVTRAVLNLPELAPLEKSNRLTASNTDDNLADLDNFVAQLKAKRQNPSSGLEIGPRTIPSGDLDSPVADHIRLE